MGITKDEAVKQILGIMAANGVTVLDIENAVKAQQCPKEEENFDLLCNINGKLTRVSFEQGKDMAPIAIFPFNKSNFYLMLDETGMVTFPPVEEKKDLMDDTQCTLVTTNRTELNEKLRELGKPILSGAYWLNGHEHGDHIGYWKAVIRGSNIPDIGYDYKDDQAKVRKCGRLQ